MQPTHTHVWHMTHMTRSPKRQKEMLLDSTHLTLGDLGIIFNTAARSVVRYFCCMPRSNVFCFHFRDISPKHFMFRAGY